MADGRVDRISGLGIVGCRPVQVALRPGVGQQVAEIGVTRARRRGSKDVSHVNPRVDPVPLRRRRHA
jgi:hypothetical protein